MTRPSLEKLARDRRDAFTALEVAEAALLGELERRVRAGDRVNIAGVAERAKLSRQTIYNRLDRLGLRRRLD